LVLTLGSGGFWGVGMGESRQKYLYLPQVTSDSIMAIVAEEFGFFGASIFLALFLLFIFLGAKVFFSTKDVLGKLMAGGIISWLAIQGLVNLSAVVILLPLTGVPFPLVSYGGSSLVSILIALGILLNIGLSQSKKRR
jgi:cell division protein FtsW